MAARGVENNIALGVFVKSVTTEVTLGCDSCKNRRTLKFPLTSVAVLTGLDSTGVPMRTQETIEVGAEAGGQAINGHTQLTSVMEITDFTCKDGICSFEQRIKDMTEAIVSKTNNIVTRR